MRCFQQLHNHLFKAMDVDDNQASDDLHDDDTDLMAALQVVLNNVVAVVNSRAHHEEQCVQHAL
jgi:hypothetical protein